VDFAAQKQALGSTFDYWLEEPYELIVEIGIWKLGRDYAFYLVSKTLASWKEVVSFIFPYNSHSLLIPLWIMMNRLYDYNVSNVLSN
jgi:hypothetical protein